jgi:UDP-arabinose 4-epimerase
MSDVGARTVLVTGGAGYIGSHACKALSHVGYLPVVYDNLSSGHDWAVKWGPLEKGDILDRGRLNEVLAQYQPEAVMHFAALAYVGESVVDPGKYYKNNVSGSLTLLEAMLEHKTHRIVFSSTCATYGIPTVIPIQEDTPQRPINPYGASKFMVERILQDFGSAHGLKSIALRYFNAAGADPEGELGEDHDPETHLVPIVLNVILGRRPHITIFGTDYDTPDGTCVRDYIHVTDLAEAHVTALAALEAGAPSQVYNLGNGSGFSVAEVISAASRITGRRVSVIEGPRRVGDPPRLVADTMRARQQLGWAPKYSDLSNILETAHRWLETAAVDERQRIG